MNKLKQQAIKLRHKGMSYGEISKIIGVSKSTLSYWLSSIELPPNISRRIKERGRQLSIAALIKRNRQQTIDAQHRNKQINQSATSEIGRLTRRELLYIGTALYWAEGYKRQKTRNGRPVTYHPVSLTNSDPLLVNLFLKFLREVCKVQEERIRASIRYFKHQNPHKLVEFWSNETGIPMSNFGKCLLSDNPLSRGVRDIGRLPYGVIQIRVADTQLFYKIMGWIEGLGKIK